MAGRYPQLSFDGEIIPPDPVVEDTVPRLEHNDLRPEDDETARSNDYRQLPEVISWSDDDFHHDVTDAIEDPFNTRNTRAQPDMDDVSLRSESEGEGSVASDSEDESDEQRPPSQNDVGERVFPYLPANRLPRIQSREAAAQN